MLGHLTIAALNVLAQIPDPGRGKAPPGAEKLTTLLQWAAYLGYAVCVLGVIIAAGGMVLQHRRGPGGGVEAGAGLGWVLAGSLLIGSASALVTAMA